MPKLEEPQWLVLLAALAFVAWYWPRARLYRPLRALTLLLGVLVLCRPYWPGRGTGVDLWVLMDRSASARELVEPRRSEIVALLKRSMSRGDRLLVVDFGEEARLDGRSDEEGETIEGLGDETRLASAVSFALSSRDPERLGRLLVVTDGYSTEPLGVVGERLRREGVPLDLRLLASTERGDVAVTRLLVPTRGKPLEPVGIEVRLRATAEGEGGPAVTVPLTLLRDGTPRATVNAAVESEREAVVRFSDRLAGGGAVAYEARIDSPDAFPGNNAASAYVEVDAGPRLLLVTAYENDPLAEALSAQGLTVDVVGADERLTLGRLSGARAVVLNNVPANRVPPEVLEALDAHVRVQGAGLLMVGGRYAFGSGGYFGSPIDPLLPVSMELREEHRTLKVAIAIVMDRSGSMSVGVDGGRTKMDLANEGAARSIELLGPHDAVAVYAVDSAAHPIVPMTSLADGSSRIVDQVRRITSTGGGIFVYEGLEAGWNALEYAPQGQRHLILFADAADSEEPGAYRELIARMVKGGASVSVIGLGTPSDPDAGLLVDIARRGNGRIFFNADPATLPALFAQETVAIARSAFIEESVGVAPQVGWLEIAAEPLEGLARVDSYNLSYLREEATSGASSTDEYEAPLVAFWNRGAGRVAAVSFPLGGELSGRARGWPGYGDFTQTLGRWLMGEDVPPGIGLSTKLDGTALVVDLLFDESWNARLASSPPELFLARGTGSDVEAVSWERLEPGHFRAERLLASGELYRGAVRLADVVLPFGPLAAPGGAEWDFDGARLAELRALSRATGGEERTELASIWSDRIQGSRLELREALLWSFLVVFLLEAFVTRLGWRLALPDIDLRRLRPVPRAPGPSAEATVAPAPEPEPEPEPKAEPESELPERAAEAAAVDQRRRRFARAKEGR